MKIKLSAVFMCVGLSALVATSSQASSLINGAGATFPSPLYTRWFSDYAKIDKEVQINYQPIGSGGGIQQLTQKTVDFGASDAPMTEKQITAAPGKILHIPTVLGAVVITYNVPEIKELRLNGTTVSEIYLGKIKKWNDKKIAALNPGLKLPGADIMVAERSDGSGTSNIFTDYLAKVSPEWKDKVGVGTSVKWPVGMGGKGNEGVTGLVKQNPNSIGYVELIYAEKNGLPYATLENKAGKFVKPSLASVTAAATAELAAIPEDFRVSITNSSGKDAYPISGFTYLLFYTEMPKATGQALVKFANWALNDGQKIAPELKYAPLPKSLVAKVLTKVNAIQLK